jgi:hypothetical protein
VVGSASGDSGSTNLLLLQLICNVFHWTSVDCICENTSSSIFTIFVPKSIKKMGCAKKKRLPAAPDCGTQQGQLCLFIDGFRDIEG